MLQNNKNTVELFEITALKNLHDISHILVVCSATYELYLLTNPFVFTVQFKKENNKYDTEFNITKNNIHFRLKYLYYVGKI